MQARTRLRTWIDKHTNQRQFAAELGVDETTLSHYLSGRRRPESPILALIEDLTGIPMRSWLPSRVGKLSDRTRLREKTAKLGAEKSHARAS